MGKKLAIIAMLAFMGSINLVYSGPGNQISDLSTKFRYALFLLNDESAKIIRDFLLIPDGEVRSCCPVRFYQGRYYRVYLLDHKDDSDEEPGCLCDDVQMAASQSLPANTPSETPANTPVIDPKVNPFFPPDDPLALRIPASAHHFPEIRGQKLTPQALHTLESKLNQLVQAESQAGSTQNIRHLEQAITSEGLTVSPEDIDGALYFYLKKRTGFNENRIFFTHNRASESNIIMVIRRSFRVRPEGAPRSHDCLEISIPVGTLEFATVGQLLSLPHEYTTCTELWQNHVFGHGVPDEEEGDTDFEADLDEFSDIALQDFLQELESHWNVANPIDNPMVERVLGAGISSVVVATFHNFRSLAFKRLYKTCENKSDAMDVISSARINLLLLSIYGIPVAPMRYEMIYNQKKNDFAIYCIQTLYDPEQFADHFLEDSEVSPDEKMKLINTIIHYMNLCDISNGYQLKVDDGFKGYFRAAVDSNYPNYCLIDGVWHLIDLSPFFWAVGDQFSSANQHILDMNQSPDYYSFIKSLCTNPIQLYVFFCGRVFRPYQRYSLSHHPDDQRKAREWLSLYHYALSRVSTLPQIDQEFSQPQWQQTSPFDEEGQDDLWKILVSLRNVDPSQKFLDGVIKLVKQNTAAGRPVILEGTVAPWQQPPAAYQLLTEKLGLLDPADYLSAPEDQRRGKRLADIFDASRASGVSSPAELLDMFPPGAEETEHRRQYLAYLRVLALLKLLSQNMAEDNNKRAANRKRLQREERLSNPPSPPVIYTALTALNDAEMTDLLSIQFNAEYIPVESDGNCLWTAIARVLNRRGIIINHENLMQAALPPTEYGEAPTQQQNWGDTDFINKILQYLAQENISVGIVILQPYGSEIVGIWYGLVGTELVVQSLGNNPVHLQQAIHNPDNITLVNHQNGIANDFQVAHWGGAVPANVPAQMTETEAEPVAGSPGAPESGQPEEEEAPSPKRPRILPGDNEPVITTGDPGDKEKPPATANFPVIPPRIFQQQFLSLTGFNLLPAPTSSSLSFPGEQQPLTEYRNLLLELIANYLLMCNRDRPGCRYQLDGMLSLLPKDQHPGTQNLRTGQIDPFLHILTALLLWLNPQPDNPQEMDSLLKTDSLTKITIIFPFIGNQGLSYFAAWSLTLVPGTRGSLQVHRTFTRPFKLSAENLMDKRRLYVVTNIPVTPLGHLAWPFHQPVLAQWWLIAPQVHAPWMLGTQLEQFTQQGVDDNPRTNPQDLQRELSDEVSQLDISSPADGDEKETVTTVLSIVQTLVPILLFSKQRH